MSIKGGGLVTYDLVAGATGVNAAPKKLFKNVHLEFKPAKTSRTYISEFHFGREKLQELLGDAMHVFLLDIPRLTFAAIIPKGEFATLVLLGDQNALPKLQLLACLTSRLQLRMLQSSQQLSTQLEREHLS